MVEQGLVWRSNYFSSVCRSYFLLGIVPGYLLAAASLYILVATYGTITHEWPPAMAISVAIVLGLSVSPFFVGRWIVVKTGWLQPTGACFCPHCGKHIPVNTPWQCGYCDSEHQLPRGPWVFLGRCSTCKRRPEEYACHYCQRTIALDAEIAARVAAAGGEPVQHIHAARRIRVPIPGETPEDARVRMAREREVVEEDTRLTEAQTRFLRAESERIKSERHVEMIKAERAHPVDKPEQMAEALRQAVGAILHTVTTKKQLLEEIEKAQKVLEESAEFKNMPESAQRRTRQLYEKKADALLYQMSNAK